MIYSVDRRHKGIVPGASYRSGSCGLLQRRVPSELVWLFIPGVAARFVLGILLLQLLPGVLSRGRISAILWEPGAQPHYPPRKGRRHKPRATGQRHRGVSPDPLEHFVRARNSPTPMKTPGCPSAEGRRKHAEMVQTSVQFYRQCLPRHAGDACARTTRAGRCEEAKIEAASAIELSQGDPHVWYDVACFHARLPEKPLAPQRLKDAIKAGDEPWEWIKHDLDNIRNELEYTELMKGKWQ